MPPRFAYWTIIAGGLPTAFRAATQDELLPTFNRIHEKHPDAEMKYFARGRLWASPEEARQAAEAARLRRSAPRGRDWRPGGAHRDPRQPFKDAKKAGNLERRRRRFERHAEGTKGKPPGTGHPGGKPPASALRRGKPSASGLRRGKPPASGLRRGKPPGSRRRR